MEEGLKWALQIHEVLLYDLEHQQYRTFSLATRTHEL